MDLFDYAQALFNQQGHLWLPSLGHFSKVRKSSYYDAEAGVFHPPGYVIGFQEDPQNTDTAFISYFSSEKNLSPGSAKYFVDKFVENIKEELETREVRFGSLGTLYKGEKQQISFKGNALDTGAQGGFFGLSPISINKFDHASFEEANIAQQSEGSNSITETPGFDALANADEETHSRQADIRTVEEIAEGEPVRNDAPRDFYSDDRVLVMKGKPSREERSNRYQFWILAGLVAVIVLIGIYLVTQNMLDPANSSNVSDQVLTKGGRTDTAIHISKAKADSALVHSEDVKVLPAPLDTNLSKISASVPSTKEKPAATVPVSSGIVKGNWLVTAGQNNNYDALAATLNKFRQMGYPEARMLDSVKKPTYFVYKIIFGYYTTQREAASARSIILKDNKIKPAVLKVQRYN